MGKTHAEYTNTHTISGDQLNDDDDLTLLIRQSETDTKVIEALRALSRVPELLQHEMRIALEALPSLPDQPS